jgi:hypothetical protein
VENNNLSEKLDELSLRLINAAKLIDPTTVLFKVSNELMYLSNKLKES